MKISIKQYSTTHLIPVQNGKTNMLRSEVYKLYKGIYGANVDYYMFKHDQFYTVAGVAQQKSYLKSI